MEEKKQKIAEVLLREHSKLPLTKREHLFLQWSGENGHFHITLSENIQKNILLVFGFSDLDSFEYIYVPSDGSYAKLQEVFKAGQPISSKPEDARMKKVIAVMAFYGNGMVRGKEI